MRKSQEDRTTRRTQDGAFACHTVVDERWSKFTDLERQFFEKMIQATNDDLIGWIAEHASSTGIPDYRGYWGKSIIKISYSITVDSFTVLQRRFGLLDKAIEDYLVRSRDRARVEAEERRVSAADTIMTHLLGLAPPTVPPGTPDVDAIVQDLDGMIQG